MSTLFKFANFIATELEDGISAGATEIEIPLAASQLLPTVAVDEEIRLVLWDGQQDPEIVAVTSNPQTGLLTVVRAKESTTAVAWAAGTQVRCVLTAEIINTALAAFFDINTVLDANFLKLSGGTLTGALTLPGAPTSGLHATTKSYVDGIGAGSLPVAGGTMAGAINMGGNEILNLPAPVTTGSAVRKSYVDDIHSSLQSLVAAGFAQYSTTGTGAAFVVTTTGGDWALDDLATISIRLHADVQGDATLNIDSTGAKQLEIESGVNVREGQLKAATTLILSYNSAADSYIIEGILAFASQAEAQAGTDNSKVMTSLRTRENVLATPGVWNIIEVITISNDVTVDFTSLGSFDELQLELVNVVPQTFNADLQLRVSQSTVFQAGASDYGWALLENITSDGDTSSWIKLANDVSDTAGHGVSLTVKVAKPVATGIKRFIWFGGWRDGDSGFFTTANGIGAFVANTAAIDGIRLLFSTGNLASGFAVLSGRNWS